MEFISKLIIVVVGLTTCSYCVFSANEQCINGLYHKDKPLAETNEYKFCTPWKNLTCCTTKLDSEVALDNSPKLYNSSWHKCGQLTKNCLKFWKRQECFYQCSPYIYKWQSDTYKDAVEGVPLCADQCNAWFDACKDDEICVENVLEDWNKTVTFENICPKDKKCKTYKERYGNGKGLCEKLWGSSYKYSEPNQEKDNCMVLWFTPDSENPNRKVQKSIASHNSLLAAMFLLPIFQVLRF